MSDVVTSAWYIMLSFWQFPFIGYLFALRQLQFFFLVSLGLNLSITALLWLVIMVSILLIQL